MTHFTFAFLSYKRMSVIKGESYPGDLTDVSACSYCHVVCLSCIKMDGVRRKAWYAQFELVLKDLADGLRRSILRSLRAPVARAFPSRARFLACVLTQPPNMTRKAT